MTDTVRLPEPQILLVTKRDIKMVVLVKSRVYYVV